MKIKTKYTDPFSKELFNVLNSTGASNEEQINNLRVLFSVNDNSLYAHKKINRTMVQFLKDLPRGLIIAGSPFDEIKPSRKIDLNLCKNMMSQYLGLFPSESADLLNYYVQSSGADFYPFQMQVVAELFELSDEALKSKFYDLDDFPKNTTNCYFPIGGDIFAFSLNSTELTYEKRKIRVPFSSLLQISSQIKENEYRFHAVGGSQAILNCYLNFNEIGKPDADFFIHKLFDDIEKENKTIEQSTTELRSKIIQSQKGKIINNENKSHISLVKPIFQIARNLQQIIKLTGCNHRLATCLKIMHDYINDECDYHLAYSVVIECYSLLLCYQQRVMFKSLREINQAEQKTKLNLITTINEAMAALIQMPNTLELGLLDKLISWNQKVADKSQDLKK